MRNQTVVTSAAIQIRVQLSYDPKKMLRRLPW